jgi:hypothetical protein
MLAKQKDFWKKKAETEYLLANNEIDRQKTIDDNQRKWTKRENESKWLLPNLPDQTEKMFYKENKPQSAPSSRSAKGLLDDDDDDEYENDDASAAEQRADKKSESLMKKVFKMFKPRKKKRQVYVPQRVRYDQDAEDKNAIMKAMRLNDERKARIEALTESASRLRVLAAVRNTLTSHRMPAHHHSVPQSNKKFSKQLPGKWGQ